MSNFYRIILGKKSAHAQEAFAGGFVGADFGIPVDLNSKLTDDGGEFNKQFIPVFLKDHPGKSKVAAGAACWALWKVAKRVQIGDFVISPDGAGSCRVGKVTGNYTFAAGQNLPHRRAVQWLDTTIPVAAMSEGLQNTTGAISAVIGPNAFEPYRPELNILLGIDTHSSAANEAIAPTEDPSEFAFEKHLEDFLVKNWNQTVLANEFSIFEDDGQLVGQQYYTDAGPIDVLALSKDKKRLLVVELKRGKASDVVVGQVLRYMGCIKETVAEPNQTVEGVIIALEDDQKMRWALMNVPSISFYRYQVSFKLIKA